MYSDDINCKFFIFLQHPNNLFPEFLQVVPNSLCNVKAPTLTKGLSNDHRCHHSSDTPIEAFEKSS